MKVTKLIRLGIALSGTCGLAGCGQWMVEQAVQEQKRIELEQKAQRDAQKANQAITNMNKKLGRKPPELGLGVTTETKTQASPAPMKHP